MVQLESTKRTGQRRANALSLATERFLPMRPQSIKTCRTCDVTRPLSEFYKNHRMPDGHLNHCKACRSIAHHAWYEKNAQRVRKAAREYRRKNVDRVLEYDRERATRADRRAYNAQKQRKNPLKKKAHEYVYRAVKSGSLIPQPCEVCGTTVNVIAHHDDYSKPLDVRWLCRSHHGMLHAGTLEEASS